jgi:UPF0755 protein
MRLLRRLLLIVCLLAIAAGGFVYWRYTELLEPFKGYSGAEQFVEVAPGSSPSTIGQRLVDGGVVRDELSFRAAMWLSGRARELKAGEYRFDRPMTALEVIDKIARGDVYRRAVTFREGLTIAEMAQIYAQGGFGTAADFQKAAGNIALIQDLDSAATDLEGYLFPDTYSLRRDTPASVLVQQMVGYFRKVFTADLQQAAAANSLTVRQAVTLASLVEKETAVPEERPIVAAVYLNRLRINEGLYADPTVIYALQRAGKYTGNLRRDDLQFDSPYNTYRYPGLPPGPIAAPGKASLEAAARPAQVDYRYFVSKNDGSHVFARTLEEHNQNVQKWQVQFFREKRNGTGK